MRFCPTGDVGRDEMAVFLERAMRGFGYPFAPTGTLFSDVPMTHWAVGPIERLFNDGVTLGCGASPLRYCPDANVTRAEMAIFLLRARHGSNYNPGSASGLVFADVPANHWAAAWIEEFAGLGYTSGCRSPPLEFCPDDRVSGPRWRCSCNGCSTSSDRPSQQAAERRVLARSAGVARFHRK